MSRKHELTRQRIEELEDMARGYMSPPAPRSSTSPSSPDAGALGWKGWDGKGAAKPSSDNFSMKVPSKQLA
eukprot:CAMPEP_0182894316 /NCGR_PEP_ID=MMETSP0034_2-20130328/25006_1 /TAXON_ID=156128 /ORGANISM="Nephroselmis pyriformis, Strain CCMP717" /LENGTH=70 /DNA_ID=CAMNT_0025028095 /DNA_START=182 /DNA_END=390 /DNA_ORIENTATION=+